MAIQVWDGTKYVGAELGRFGPSGTLKEALVWDGTQYVKVWPTGPAYTWYDDFTSPTLHERWQLLDGDYTPPGLTDAAVLGPQISDDCMIGLTADPVGDFVQMVATDDDFSLAVTMGISWNGSVSFVVGDFTNSAPLTGTLSLRRQGGAWTVLMDGQPVMGYNGPLSAPDDGGDLYLGIEARDSTITQVSYTEL